MTNRYRVEVQYPVWENDWTDVEAEDENEAADKASEIFDSEDLEIVKVKYLGEAKEIPETPDPNQMTMALEDDAPKGIT